MQYIPNELNFLFNRVQLEAFGNELLQTQPASSNPELSTNPLQYKPVEYDLKLNTMDAGTSVAGLC